MEFLLKKPSATFVLFFSNTLQSFILLFGKPILIDVFHRDPYWALPLLLFPYINDLTDTDIGSKVRTYADDVQI